MKEQLKFIEGVCFLSCACSNVFMYYSLLVCLANEGVVSATRVISHDTDFIMVQFENTQTRHSSLNIPFPVV